SGRWTSALRLREGREPERQRRDSDVAHDTDGERQTNRPTTRRKAAMKYLAALSLTTLLTSTLVFGEAVCPPPNCTLTCSTPASRPFEMAPHTSPVSRMLSDGTEVRRMDPMGGAGPKVNSSVTIGTLPPISLTVSPPRQFATLENGPSAPGKCFTIRASGFED